MSGIAGIVHWEGPSPARHDVVRMAALMAHRGDGDCQLAACRNAVFANTFRSMHQNRRKGALYASDDLLLTADCRLYNHAALVAELFPDRNANDISEGHLLAAGYRKWAHALPDHLDGDFAFAIWDSRNSEFFAARDPFSIKPFFFHETAQGIAFASEPKQLLSLSGAAVEPDPLTIAEYLFLKFQEFEHTFFKGIRRMLPAHLIVARKPGFKQRRWWNPSLDERERYPDHESYFRHFQDLLREAVEKRLDTDYPIGCHLSGGLDSSSIVLLADRIYRSKDRSRPRFDTISATYLQPECNESRQIDAVTRAAGFVNHQFDADLPSLFSDLPRMQWQSDRPFADASHSTFVETVGVLHDIGARTLLMGFGGDEIATEGWYLHDLAERGQWLRAAREIHGIHSSRALTWSMSRMAFDTLKSRVPPRLTAFMKQRLGIRRWQPPHYATPELVSVFMSHPRREFVDRAGHASKTQYMMHRDLMYPENTSLAELYETRGAYAGHEPRMPFLDRPLAEYVLSIPFDALIDAPKWKGLIRRGLSDLLPPEVQQRRLKIDLDPHVMNAIAREKDDVLDSLGDPSSWASAPYVDTAAAHALIRTPMPPGSKLFVECDRAFRLLCLEIWLRSMIKYEELRNRGNAYMELNTKDIDKAGSVETLAYQKPQLAVIGKISEVTRKSGGSSDGAAAKKA